MGMLIGVPLTATAYKLVFEYLANREKSLGIKTIKENKPEEEPKKIFNFKKNKKKQNDKTAANNNNSAKTKK